LLLQERPEQGEDRLAEEKRTYDIIIPVYGALPYLEQCINSILKNTRHPYNLIIIDDGNDPLIKEYLRTIKSARIITNKKNLGWLKSCNIGIENSENDVILLNSDTLVTEGWLEKMDRCAHSDSRIRMVNPLSNSAAFLSIPYPLEFNSIPAGFTLESFSNLISELSECRYPSIPAAPGFCLLIKREIFNQIGVFDEKFELGYWEEFDFCMRVKRKGYKAVCCDDAFVYHYGQKSFGDSLKMKVYRVRACKKFLREDGDRYETSVNRFNRNNPLTYLRTKLLMKISEISPEYRDMVSIIMPVYNKEKYLEDAIKSVLGQSYSNFELIIVDDGSTDNSINIAKEFAKEDKRVTVIALKENQGISKARNEGLKRARGEFITQFDPDDVMVPDAIKSRLEFLNSHPEVDLVFGRLDKFINAEGDPIENDYFEEVQRFYRMEKNRNFYEKIKKLELKIPLPNPTCMYRREVLFREGYYDENLLYMSDIELSFRIVRCSEISCLDKPIVSYRLHDSNVSGKIDKETGEWVERPENACEIRYFKELLGHYRRETEEWRKVRRVSRFQNVENGGRSMKKIKKVDFSEDRIGKSNSGNNRMLEQTSQVELLLGQIGHMVQLIDDLREKIRNQDLAIIAKDQHINNLNKVITPKDQHIAYLESVIRDRDAAHYQNLMNLTKEIARIKKYSVFYNLLFRFRRELLKFFGKTHK